MRDGLCNNCGMQLIGRYCHACGQQEVEDEWRSLGAIVRHLCDEIVSVDSKSLRSLMALLRPGHLSAEFIAGRRQAYLAPWKLYFLCAALFFLSAPLIAGFTFERHLTHDTGGEFRAMSEERMAVTHMPPAIFAEHFDSHAKTVYTLAPLLSVLAMTLLLRMFYRSRFHRLGPHAVVAVHYVAFFYLVALGTGAIGEVLHPSDWLLLGLAQSVLGVYLFVALRRVYRERAGRTVAKTATLIVLAFAIDIPINLGARLLTVALT